MGSKRSSHPAECRREGLLTKLRRRLRGRVPAGARRRGPGFPQGWDGWDGGASVREPRRPLPSGPRAGADAAPIPDPDVEIDLPKPDSRP